MQQQGKSRRRSTNLRPQAASLLASDQDTPNLSREPPSVSPGVNETNPLTLNPPLPLGKPSTSQVRRISSGSVKRGLAKKSSSQRPQGVSRQRLPFPRDKFVRINPISIPSTDQPVRLARHDESTDVSVGSQDRERAESNLAADEGQADYDEEHDVFNIANESRIHTEDPLLEAHLVTEQEQPSVIMPAVVIAQSESPLDNQAKQPSCSALVSTGGGRLFLFGIALLITGIIVSGIVCGSGLCSPPAQNTSNSDDSPSISTFAPTESSATFAVQTASSGALFPASRDPSNLILEALSIGNESFTEVASNASTMNIFNHDDSPDPKPLLPCSISGLDPNETEPSNCSTTSSPTCLMVYMMADNQLEYYIHRKYFELANATFVTSPNVRIWIYYDALNQGSFDLPTIANTTRNISSQFFSGSIYLNYDASLGGMRIDKHLQEEQNSDLSSTVEAFLEHAMTDCQEHNHTSMMAAFTSLGSGFAGLGGDLNHRRLLQTNRALSTAIHNALQKSKGTETKLDVLGFDASLMQAVGAAEEYMNVAHYILASESVVPGHGWPYSLLSIPGSALDLAYQIQDAFLNQDQAPNKSPRTISILDTEKFSTFIKAFDKLFEKVLGLLESGDASLQAFVARARSSAVVFEGIMDSIGTQSSSALDLGSFLEQFGSLCNPEGDLGTDLNLAIKTYNDMFVTRGCGPGTAAGTGIHITWPSQDAFQIYPDLWNQVLFHNADYVMSGASSFTSFLQWFLLAGPQPDRGSVSKCSIGAAPDVDIALMAPKGSLILRYEVSGSSRRTSSYSVIIGSSVEATISLAASEVTFQFGIDLSDQLKIMLEWNGYKRSYSNEYLYLLGGNVAGVYKGSQVTAHWDQNFYLLTSGEPDMHHEIYVFDQGSGSRKAPVMFFPESKVENMNKLQFSDYLFFDMDYWLEQGAHYGFLSFSVGLNVTISNLSLFISSSSAAFVENPRHERGWMIPLVYVHALIQGINVEVLPGGAFHQSAIAWSEQVKCNVVAAHAIHVDSPDSVFAKDHPATVFPSRGPVMMSAHAHNHENPSLEQFRYHQVYQYTVIPASTANHTSAGFDLDVFQFSFAGVNINAEIARDACPDAWQATVSCVISTCPEFMDVCPEFEVPEENQGTVAPGTAATDPPADAGDMGEEMMEEGMEMIGNMTMDMNMSKPETMPEMTDETMPDMPAEGAAPEVPTCEEIEAEFCEAFVTEDFTECCLLDCAEALQSLVACLVKETTGEDRSDCKIPECEFPGPGDEREEDGPAPTPTPPSAAAGVVSRIAILVASAFAFLTM